MNWDMIPIACAPDVFEIRRLHTYSLIWPCREEVSCHPIKELPDMDAAFRDRAYRLLGVRRVGDHAKHDLFANLCDEIVVV